MIKIWKEKPGVVSAKTAWCASYGGSKQYPTPCYLHICDSLFSLLYEIIMEHRQDKHLVGY